MSDQFRLDMAQLNTLATDLGRIANEALPLAKLVVQKSAADIKRDAQAFAPVDTGNLRSSIGYETEMAPNSVGAEVGPSAAYGAFVEFGTSQHAPAAYMGPAFDRHAGEFEQAMGAIVDRFGQ